MRGSVLVIGDRLEKIRYRYLVFFAILAGLVLRLVFINAPGYSYDMNISHTWGEEVTKYGIVNSYTSLPSEIERPNYPPVMMWIWAGTVKLESVVGRNLFLPSYVWMKIPSVVADLGLCLVVFLIIKHLTNVSTALLGSLLLLINPALFFNSTIWGQNDSIYTLFILIGLLSLMKRSYFVSGLFFGVSLLTKIQSVVILPIGLYWLIVQLVSRKVSSKDLVRLSLGGGLAGLFILWPFIVSGKLNIIGNVYLHSVGYYSSVSMNAYNFWWILFSNRAGGMLSTDPFVIGLSFRLIGFLLFILITSTVSLRTWNGHRSDKDLWKRLFYLLCVASLAFFLFNTEMHERYLFLFIPLGIIPATYSVMHRRLYLLISLLHILNLAAVLPLSMFDGFVFNLIPNLSIISAMVLLISSAYYFVNDI